MSSHAALPLPTADAAGMRTQNATLVLRLIWRERQLSRADIARQTGLSPSTVGAIVGELAEAGLVREIGAGASRGGRRPVLVGFRDDAYALVGVELGATHVAAVLTDLRGNVRAFRDTHVAVRDDPRGALATARALIEECLAAERVSKKRVVGIGVAVPSPVHPDRPGKLSPLIMPAWADHDVREELADAFGVPVLVDNDANLGALAEHWWGAARGAHHFAYVKVGTGVGSGHVIDGEVYRGSTGFAGEIGHMSIDPNGELCVCGLRGCLATHVGSPALVKRARALLGEYPASSLAKGPTTIDIIEKAAIDGDQLALRVVRDAAEYLGIAIAGMLNLMNPSVVIVGGGITQLGDRFLVPLRETVQQRTRVSAVVGSTILMSELGWQTIAVGAASMVLKEALANPRLFPAANRAAKVVR